MAGRVFSFSLLVTMATPALAQSVGATIPEPSSLALLGFGLAGVALGKRLSRPRRD